MASSRKRQDGTYEFADGPKAGKPVPGFEAKPVKIGASFTTSVAPLLSTLELAANALDAMEGAGETPSSDLRTTIANIVDDVPAAGEPIGRLIGGKKYQKYNFHATNFNNLMLKIASGSQVTPSEAVRWKKASTAQIWDDPEIIRMKGKFRRSFIESSERLLRNEPFDKDAINAEAERVLSEGRGENKSTGLPTDKMRRLEELRRKRDEGTLQ